jgi:hypothetical protein
MRIQTPISRPGRSPNRGVTVQRVGRAIQGECGRVQQLVDESMGGICSIGSCRGRLRLQQSDSRGGTHGNKHSGADAADGAFALAAAALPLGVVQALAAAAVDARQPLDRDRRRGRSAKGVEVDGRARPANMGEGTGKRWRDGARRRARQRRGARSVGGEEGARASRSG